jgi:transposase
LNAVLNLTDGRRIFLARAVTDMRKSFDTLAALVQYQLGRDPFAGDVFVFIGKRRNRLKMLIWDASGFWVLTKRLEQGTFAVPAPLLDPTATSSVTLSPAEMAMLLEGISAHRATYHRHYHRPPPASTPTSDRAPAVATPGDGHP